MENINNVKNTQIVKNERYNRIRFYPVMTEENEEIYSVSEDRRDLRVDVKKALDGAPRRMMRKAPRIPEVSLARNDYIYTRIACNVPDFHDQVETLIFNRTGCHKDELFAFDAGFLLAIFPNLKTVCCHDTIAIENASSALRVLDPFAVGEYSFELAKAKDFKEANRYFRMLWALDSKWAKFWGEVATDYNRKPEDHPAYDPQGTMIYDGMDDLFKVYLLGWYPKGLPIEDDFEKVYAEKHKNFQKAIKLLPIRFQNCSLHEVSDKLFWDLQYVEVDSNPDFDSFFRVLAETEWLYPGALDQMFEDWSMNDDEKEKLRDGMTRATNAMKGID